MIVSHDDKQSHGRECDFGKKIALATEVLKFKRSTKFCFVARQKLSSQPKTFTFYVKLGFVRPDLDGKRPAKGKCLVRKARDKEVFI